MAVKRTLGDRGEQAAEAHLERHGYRIRERNYHTRWGEVDLIAEEGGYLVFVEVKTRRSLRGGLPRESVGPLKQQRLTRAAYSYLAAHRDEMPCRFDVVEVLLDGPVEGVHVIRDAFPAVCGEEARWSE